MRHTLSLLCIVISDAVQTEEVLTVQCYLMDFPLVKTPAFVWDTRKSKQE